MSPKVSPVHAAAVEYDYRSGHRAWCPCGWLGDWRADPSEAFAAAVEHQIADGEGSQP